MDEIKVFSKSKEEREKIIKFAKENGYQFSVNHYSSKDYEEFLEEILGDVKDEDIDSQHDRWIEYLQDNLEFPFKAVTESMEEYVNCFIKLDADILHSETKLDNALKSVDPVVSIKSISGCDDMRGIIVEAKSGRKTRHYPLCTIEAVDYESENWELVHNYGVWLSGADMY